MTQVLKDGTNSYLYGNGRISQTGSVTEYFLRDALGSVRQLTDPNGEITLAKSYNPYGNVTLSSGDGTSPFAYTGEQQDASGLTYLRARYYSSGDGRFLSRDTWGGDYRNPLSLNRWMYVEGNPVSRIDPTGRKPLRMGYVEGVSLSGAVFVGAIKGEEIVYNYATMSRARFRYHGNMGGLVVAGSGTAYVGGILGFRYGLPFDTHDKNNLFRKDYSGPFDGVYFGAGIKVLEGVSAGLGIFHSPDGRIKGAFTYVSGSIGAPIPVEGAFFSTDYELSSGVKHYADAKGRVDRTRLISDILKGDNSLPFLSAFTPVSYRWG